MVEEERPDQDDEDLLDLDEEEEDLEEEEEAKSAEVTETEWGLKKRLVVGIGAGVVALGVMYGVTQLYQKFSPRISEEDYIRVLSPEERLARLDEIVTQKLIGYGSIEQGVERLAKADSLSSIWGGYGYPDEAIAELGKRLKEALDEKKVLNDSLETYKENLEKLATQPKQTVVKGHSQKELDRRVKEAETQGRASGYESGLKTGETRTLEQAFSLISPQAKALEYTVERKTGYVEFTVSSKAISLDELPLTGVVLREGIGVEVKIRAIAERLLGLGVKEEDVRSYMEGSGISRIRVTSHPITREATGIHTEDLEGKASSYRPNKAMEE